MRRYDHVIFDLDGTLVDTLADLTAAVNYMLTEMGLPTATPELVRTYIGAGTRKLVERAIASSSENDVDSGLVLFLHYYREHLLDQTRPYPGIEKTLALLQREGVVMSLLSNKPAELSTAILRGLVLLPYFAAVIGGDSLPVRKPDPGGVERLVKLSAVPAARTVLVGDSLIDAQTARVGGIAFCGVTWGFASGDLRALEGIDTIDVPAQLLALIGVSGGENCVGS